MLDRALVVFVRHPTPGAVKTRLAPALGATVAAELYRALAETALVATAPRPGEYERLVFFDPPDAAEAMRSWLPGLRLLRQAGGDLGARMEDAFARAFRRGASRVALVGTDTPRLTRETVLRALDRLDDADVVVGPAEDGGYYLLALREPRPDLVRGMEWGTSSVLEETCTRAEAASLRLHRLGPLRDIDRIEDLRAEWPLVEAMLAGRPSLLEALGKALPGTIADAGAQGRGERDGPRRLPRR